VEVKLKKPSVVIDNIEMMDETFDDYLITGSINGITFESYTITGKQNIMKAFALTEELFQQILIT